MKLLPTGSSEFSRPNVPTPGSIKQTSSPNTLFRSSITGASLLATSAIWRSRIDMASSVSGCTASKMVGDHLRYAARNLLGRWYVQKLVGPVRVGVRSKHSRDEELRLWKPLTQHPHERNSAAFAHIGSRFAEVVIRGRIEATLEPWRQFRRVPSAGAPVGLERNLASVRRIFLQNAFELSRRDFWIDGWRQPKRQTHRRARTQHVAGIASRRQTVGADDREGGTPGAV